MLNQSIALNILDMQMQVKSCEFKSVTIKQAVHNVKQSREKRM